MWVDGIHTGVMLGNDDRLWCSVMRGARLDGTQELKAAQDGYPEYEESCAELCCGTSKAIQKITEAQNKAEAVKAGKEFAKGFGTK